MVLQWEGERGTNDYGRNLIGSWECLDMGDRGEVQDVERIKNFDFFFWSAHTYGNIRMHCIF